MHHSRRTKRSLPRSIATVMAALLVIVGLPQVPLVAQAVEPAPAAACGPGEWTAEFFDNKDLTGAPVLTRCDAGVDFTWEGAPPGVPVGQDAYSVRWTTTQTFAAGTYRFDVLSDDGVRVRVDGELIIDEWRDQPQTPFQASTTLTEGEHTVVVEYFEGAELARIRATWTNESDPGPTTCQPGEWVAEYYGNRSLTGAPVFVRCDPELDFSWPGSPPGVPVGGDEFSVRWTTTQTFPAGEYRFEALGDDGIRVRVDGQQLIDGWKDQPTRGYVATTPLSEGPHTVVVEFFEGTGAARARVLWSQVTPPPPVDCSAGKVISVIAHPDDDLLFMNPSLINAIEDGKCVRTVTVTAGDAGLGAAYYAAREMGHRAAYADMADVADVWTFSDAGVAGRSITMATNAANPRVSLVWMRLPDSPDNQLRQLYEGQLASLGTMDGSSTYTSAELTAALLELLTDYAPTRINAMNWVDGDGDHRDHFATARYTRDAVETGGLSDTLTTYIAYPISLRPENVSGAELAAKSSAFYTYAPYDTQVCSTPAECVGLPYADWLPREYTIDTDDPSTPDASQMVAVAPERVMDTRSGIGVPSGLRSPGSVVDLQVAGEAPVPASASAVVMNVTVTQAARPGFVQVLPTGQSTLGGSSNVNVERPGQTIPNLVTVPIGEDGKVSFYIQAGGHLVADVVGYYDPSAGAVSAGRFIGLSPQRVLDTRGAGSAKPEPRSATSVQVTGRAGVPGAGVSAVVLNVTATQAAQAGYVQVVPSGGPTEFGESSSLNLERSGQTIANLVVVPVGENGEVDLYTLGSTHLIADVVGYYTDDSATASTEGLFVPLQPARALDTRNGAAGVGKLGPRDQVDFRPLGRVGVPANGVSAVLYNVTATQADGPGYVQVFPTGQGVPGASSNLNLERAGQTIPNAAVATVGDGGGTSLFTFSGTHLILDVFGYFTD